MDSGQVILPPKPKSRRGGPRPNSGRPIGATTKKLKAIAEEAAAKGVTPIDVMLGNMRYYHERAEDFTTKLEQLAETISAADMANPANEKILELVKMINKVGDFRMKAQTCAVDAAGYIHPRLSAVAVKVDQGDSKKPMLEITDETSLKEISEHYADLLRNGI